MAYEIIYQILAILAFAIFLGEIFEQFRLPSVAGELLAGLIIGPSFANLVSVNDQTQAVSSIALFFIIFHIGFEAESKSVRKRILPGALLSTTGFFVPLIIGVLLSVLIIPMGIRSDFVFSLAITVPSISIISVLVSQLKLIGEPSGQVLISSVVIIDTVAFIFLAALSRSVINTVSVIGSTVLVIIVFAAVDLVLNLNPKAFQRFLGRASRVLKREDIAYALLIIVGLFVAEVFQAIGVSFMVGAFFAGLIIHDGLIGRRPFQIISNTLARTNRAFFIPLFFGFAGVEAVFPFDQLPDVGKTFVIVVATLVPALVLSYFVARRLLNIPRGFAKQISVILGGRGAVGIVIATVALSSGLIKSSTYSLIIVATLVTSIVVPILLRERKRQIEDESSKKSQGSKVTP